MFKNIEISESMIFSGKNNTYTRMTRILSLHIHKELIKIESKFVSSKN